MRRFPNEETFHREVNALEQERNKARPFLRSSFDGSITNCIDWTAAIVSGSIRSSTSYLLKSAVLRDLAMGEIVEPLEWR